jgi:motility quorum-sensing regulator/GCU-specific mRNA interferase toxin
MVTEAEHRDTPEYSLERVRTLAKDGSVYFGSRKVQRDIANLSYAPEDVHKCLQTLNECHFHRAERYAARGPWFDVYLISYAGPSGAIDDLYVKLKLDRDCIVVILASFHL